MSTLQESNSSSSESNSERLSTSINKVDNLISRLDVYFAQREIDLKNIELKQVVLDESNDDVDESTKLIPDVKKTTKKWFPDISKSMYQKLQQCVFIVAGGLVGATGFFANVQIGICFTFIGLGFGTLVAYR